MSSSDRSQTVKLGPDTTAKLDRLLRISSNGLYQAKAIGADAPSHRDHGQFRRRFYCG
jgi:hypothetical protein